MISYGDTSTCKHVIRCKKGFLAERWNGGKMRLRETCDMIQVRNQRRQSDLARLGWNIQLAGQSAYLYVYSQHNNHTACPSLALNSPVSPRAALLLILEATPPHIALQLLMAPYIPICLLSSFCSGRKGKMRYVRVGSTSG